jgi:steroid 5-alpha reductase family enzyme
VVAVLVTVWGTRLSTYLAIRNLGHGEDYRYQAMRRRWGRRFPLVSLGTVFILQATLMWIVSLPVQLTMEMSDDPGWPAFIGIAVWGVGMLFETIGDWQLARFKRDPDNAGKVMDRGLWRLTRHPNYFGDFCVWWGLFLVAVTGVSMLWTMIGPILMSTLLLRVSGVALLEKTITSRRPGYADYVRRTSAFFPRPPGTRGLR